MVVIAAICAACASVRQKQKEDHPLKTEISIIGNGCAALSAVSALREAGYAGRIDIFSDSILPAYNPMLTTYYLSGKVDYEGLLLQGSGSDFYEKHSASLHLNTPIARLRAREKRFFDAAGSEYTYDNCLVATGARPFIPPMEGADSEGVFTMRTAEDALRVKEYMAGHTVRSAIVVGASMVGIKVAEYLLHSGVSCCLADFAPHIFPRAAHPNCARLIEKELLSAGMTLKFGSGISRIEKKAGALHAWFGNEETPLAADLIVLCIGVRPNLDFVDPNEVALRGGIVVDGSMRTSCAGLYAAGDCAAGSDIVDGEKRIVGLMASARYQGRAAALHMAGAPEPFAGSTPHNITHFMDMDFIGIGDVAAQGDVLEKYIGDHRYLRVVTRDGRLLGVNLLNLPEMAGLFKNLFFKNSAPTKAALPHTTFAYDEFAEQLIGKHLRAARRESE